VIAVDNNNAHRMNVSRAILYIRDNLP